VFQSTNNITDAVASQKAYRICYSHVLWAQANTKELIIHYARERKKTLEPATKAFEIPASTPSFSSVQNWLQLLLGHAYGESKPRKHLKIFLNPSSGKGAAVKMYHKYAEPLFLAAQCRLDLQETSYPGQAGELVREDRTIASWDAVVCCSGDGLPHEVINGLASRNDTRQTIGTVPIVQLPGGSANAMCLNMLGTTSMSHAALSIIKGIPRSIDLMSITQGTKRHISFLSQNLGLLAECDLDTEKLRFLGPRRFAVGFFQRLFKPPVYGCDLATYSAPSPSCLGQSNDSSHSPIYGKSYLGFPELRFGTVNDPVPENWKHEHCAGLGIFFAGQLPFMDAKARLFPDAEPDNGFVDMLTVESNIGARKLLEMFRRVENGTHVSMAEVRYRKVSAFRVVPHRSRGAFSVDGERFSCKPFQVEVHPQLGLTLVATTTKAEEK
jgi:sphingosine kinase